MAAAEARAVWQRTANRCFVQEDAKRAPKLACCQSSSATSKSVDAGPTSAADESDHVTVDATPFNRKSSFSNLSPDSGWWLYLQPNNGYQNSSTYEKLNALEDEVETLKAIDGNKTYKGDVTHFGGENYDSSYHMHCDFETDAMKKPPNDRMQEAYSKSSQAFPEEMDIDPIGCSVSKETIDLCLGSDYPWIEGDKTEPWWRTTDRDELASLVSQKSLNHFENCDLPPPRKKYLRRHPCANISGDKLNTTSFDWEAKPSGFSNLTAHAQGSLNSSNEGLLYVASDKSSSYTTIHEDVKEKQQILEEDPSKAKLMEALCHSQKRAREAEEEAKQAYAEKEDIVQLFFKQASQIFAYKQWFQLLQLETLYTQIKNKDQPIPTLFPVALPWMSYEGRKPRKRKQMSAKAKQEGLGRPKNDITTYTVAFALGLSLVGAGLLLGWTVGWMLSRL